MEKQQSAKRSKGKISMQKLIECAMASCRRRVRRYRLSKQCRWTEICNSSAVRVHRRMIIALYCQAASCACVRACVFNSHPITQPTRERERVRVRSRAKNVRLIACSVLRKLSRLSGPRIPSCSVLPYVCLGMENI